MAIDTARLEKESIGMAINQIKANYKDICRFSSEIVNLKKILEVVIKQEGELQRKLNTEISGDEETDRVMDGIEKLKKLEGIHRKRIRELNTQLGNNIDSLSERFRGVKIKEVISFINIARKGTLTEEISQAIIAQLKKKTS